MDSSTPGVETSSRRASHLDFTRRNAVRLQTRDMRGHARTAVSLMPTTARAVVYELPVLVQPALGRIIILVQSRLRRSGAHRANTNVPNRWFAVLRLLATSFACVHRVLPPSPKRKIPCLRVRFNLHDVQFGGSIAVARESQGPWALGLPTETLDNERNYLLQELEAEVPHPAMRVDDQR